MSEKGVITDIYPVGQMSVGQMGRNPWHHHDFGFLSIYDTMHKVKRAII